MVSGVLGLLRGATFNYKTKIQRIAWTGASTLKVLLPLHVVYAFSRELKTLHLQTFWKVTSGGGRFPLEPDNLSGVLV